MMMHDVSKVHHDLVGFTGKCFSDPSMMLSISGIGFAGCLHISLDQAEFPRVYLFADLAGV